MVIKKLLILLSTASLISAPALASGYFGGGGGGGGSLPSGLSPVGTGAVTGDGSSISYGTLGVGNGGTGLTTLGTALQLVRVNSAGTALEYVTPSYAAAGANSDITSLTGLTGDIEFQTNAKGLKLKRGATLLDSGTNEATLTGTLKISNPLGVASGGTGLTTLGTASQQIRVNSGGTALEWFTPTAGAAAGANSDITSLSGLTTPLSVSQGGTGSNYGAGLVAGPTTKTCSANTTLTTTDGPVVFATANYLTLTLPQASTCPGKVFTFVELESSATPVTIATHSGDTHFYQSKTSFAFGGGYSVYSWSVVSDGVNTWYPLGLPVQHNPAGNAGNYTADSILVSQGYAFSNLTTFKVDYTGKVYAGTWDAGAVTTPALAIPSGSNKKIGSGTLSSGTCTVSNTAVTSNSKIFVTPTSTNANAGVLAVTAKTAATSFVVTSSNGSDDNTFDYVIIEAP